MSQLQKRKRKKKLKKFFTSPLFVIIIFTTLALIITLNRKNKEQSLRSNIVQTNGKLIAFSKDGRGQSVYVTFDYNIRDSQYWRMDGMVSEIFENRTIASKFINKRFPVIYDSTNPSNSHILIDPADFYRYGIPFPDSLNWVLPYFE